MDISQPIDSTEDQPKENQWDAYQQVDRYHGEVEQKISEQNAAEKGYCVAGWSKGQFTLNDISPYIEELESKIFETTTDLRIRQIDPANEES